MKRPSIKLKHIFFSVMTGLCLIIADYLIANLGYPIFDAIDVLAVTEFYSHHEKEDIPYNPDDVIWINVGYDKAVGYKVEDGDTLGTVDITDRQKLIRLLHIAQGAQYKYLFVDVRFPQGIETDCDAELFDLMCKIPRFIIPTHNDETQADTRLKAVSAFADYGTTLTSGFTRYELQQEHGPSIAMRMYQDLDSGSVIRHGVFYTSCGSICDNNMFVPIPSELVEAFDPETPDEFMRLGADLFAQNDDEATIDAEMREMMRDKYVIIGDFDNDIHTTYAGDIPGPVITLLAYMNVKNGQHKLNLLAWVLLWLVYTSITYKILTTSTFSDILKSIKINGWPRLTKAINMLGNIKSRFLRFLISYLTWSLALLALNMIYYVLFTILITTIIPSLCFTILSQIKSSRVQSA